MLSTSDPTIREGPQRTATAVLTSTLDQVKASPSYGKLLEDLFLLPPRRLAQAGSFLFFSIPKQLHEIVRNSGSVIADATEGATSNATLASSTGNLSAFTIADSATANLDHVTPRITWFGAFNFQNFKNMGGFFAYAFSKWALTCFTLAIVLNRIQIYATGRRHINLGWPLRLALRIVPIFLFLTHARSLCQAIRCQTSPDYLLLKYGEANKNNVLDFADSGGFLYEMSKRLLFWQSDRDSCLAVGMIRPDQDIVHLRGSLARLWPFFKTLCLGQLIENFSCAVQGRPVMTETGLSLFEHSLAFAEVEAMISHKIGSGPTKATATSKSGTGEESFDVTSSITREFLLGKVNTPPEILLIGLISCFNNLTSHVLAVFGMQGRYRLLNTGVWGVCFMSVFIWGFFSWNPHTNTDAWISRFPTVCIVGFIPHLLILVGISICACIYSFALLLSVLSLPVGLPPARSLAERFWLAYDNFQVNAQISSLRLNMHDDFYSNLLRIGFTALTVASEAVYLNEKRPIDVSRWTWLEEERMAEIEQSRQGSNLLKSTVTRDSRQSDFISAHNTATQRQVGSRKWVSGYAREKTTEQLKSGLGRGNRRMAADGIGAVQRGSRYMMAYELFTGIFWLITNWFAIGLLKITEKVGLSQLSLRLRRQVDSLRDTKNLRKMEVQRTKTEAQPESLDFWLLSDEGVLSLPEDENVDVEVETKKRLKIASDEWGQEEEQKLDSTLYGWWMHGGWWGEKDNSGAYKPSEQEDDTTSVVSISTDHSEAEWESEDIEDGRRTPTQRDHYSLSRESSPAIDLSLDTARLARLLNPKDAEERQEARILAHHLESDRIITRSQYHYAQEFDRAHVLTSTRYRPPGFTTSSPSGKLTPYEEADVLEHLILSRRSHHAATAAIDPDSSTAWRDGAEGLGSGGPQCVLSITQTYLRHRKTFNVDNENVNYPLLSRTTHAGLQHTIQSDQTSLPLETAPIMQIIIKRKNRSTFTLAVTPTTTIGEVELMISRHEDIPVENHYLTFDGRNLKRGKRELVFYNIFAGDTLYLVVGEKIWKVRQRQKRARKKARKAKLEAATAGMKNRDVAKKDGGDSDEDDVTAMLVMSQDIQAVGFVDDDQLENLVVKDEFENEHHEQTNLATLASSKESATVEEYHEIDENEEKIEMEEEVELQMCLA